MSTKIRKNAQGEIAYIVRDEAISRPNELVLSKRTVSQRERDLDFIANLYLGGFSQMEITERLNIERADQYTLSRSQVRRDIQDIHQRWLESSLNSMEEKVVIECSKLDRVEHEMWNLYERSLEKRTVDENTVVTGQNIGDEKEEPSGAVIKGQVVPSNGRGSQSKSKSFNRIKTYHREETSYGNIQILAEIRTTIMERSKLMGLIVAKSNVTFNWRKEAEAAGLNPQEFVDEATERILTSAMARGSIFGSVAESQEDSGSEEGERDLVEIPG